MIQYAISGRFATSVNSPRWWARGDDSRLGRLANGHDLIVLEGCDGAGKTTLAAALAARHGHAIVHATRSPEGTDLFAKYHAILARPGPLVLDRSFVSELVYGPLDRGHPGSHSRAPPA